MDNSVNCTSMRKKTVKYKIQYIKIKKTSNIKPSKCNLVYQATPKKLVKVDIMIAALNKTPLLEETNELTVLKCLEKVQDLFFTTKTRFLPHDATHGANNAVARCLSVCLSVSAIPSACLSAGHVTVIELQICCCEPNFIKI